MAIDFSKKIAGVPVVYLAGGAVAIFAVVAWRMKPSPEGDAGSAADTDEAVLDENGLADGSSPYAGLRSNGTVIVQPAPPVEAPEPDKPDTNDEWIRDGAEWLVASKDVSGTAAYTALSKFIDGKSRSTLEAQWVEWTIKEKGFPPDPFAETPLPTTPTTPTTPTIPKPPTTTPKPAAGSKPGYGWYQVRPGDSAASIAKKYAISVTAFYAYNGVGRIVAGEWVKVRYYSNPYSGYRG